MRHIYIVLCFYLLLPAVFVHNLKAQVSDSCALKFGTNISGLADWGASVPFVNLMHSCRTWYTKSIGDPNSPWNSDKAAFLSYRPDGYPTHVPQEIDSSAYPQVVSTIWAITSGWPPGKYTLLWEGTGKLELWGTHESIVDEGTHRKIINFPNTQDGVLELKITASDINDPIHNIRLLMPGTESTYENQPFYQAWLDLLEPFETIRFMDWGQTNNWGQATPWDWGDSTLVDWKDRSQMDYYTWTHNKGVPYEMMIQLMEQTKKDGWVCVPHVASEEYQREMAKLFKNELPQDRHLYIEYSNEIWNWSFGQAQWANTHGCVAKDIPWPEGTAPYVQNMLDYWTDEYADALDRITRVVGVFTAYQDVAERLAYNIDPSTFDAIAPTYYFGLSDTHDANLDALGASATVQDIASAARESMESAIVWIENIKGIADSLNKQLCFYEGGQHITPHPFGVEPTYAQALLDIQRDTAMYNLYSEWFDAIRAVHSGEEPYLLMNFSLVGGRSAKYGSWGVLESITQDTAAIPAPKYKALVDNIFDCSMMTQLDKCPSKHTVDFSIYPNPTTGTIFIKGATEKLQVRILNMTGQAVLEASLHVDEPLELAQLMPGVYFVELRNPKTKLRSVQKIIRL